MNNSKPKLFTFRPQDLDNLISNLIHANAGYQRQSVYARRFEVAGNGRRVNDDIKPIIFGSQLSDLVLSGFVPAFEALIIEQFGQAMRGER